MTNEFMTETQARKWARDLDNPSWYWSPARRTYVLRAGGVTTPGDLAVSLAAGRADPVAVADYWVLAAGQAAITTAFAAEDAEQRDADDETHDSAVDLATALDRHAHAQELLAELTDTAADLHDAAAHVSRAQGHSGMTADEAEDREPPAGGAAPDASAHRPTAETLDAAEVGKVHAGRGADGAGADRPAEDGSVPRGGVADSGTAPPLLTRTEATLITDAMRPAPWWPVPGGVDLTVERLLGQTPSITPFLRGATPTATLADYGSFLEDWQRVTAVDPARSAAIAAHRHQARRDARHELLAQLEDQFDAVCGEHELGDPDLDADTDREWHDRMTVLAGQLEGLENEIMRENRAHAARRRPAAAHAAVTTATPPARTDDAVDRAAAGRGDHDRGRDSAAADGPGLGNA